LAQVFPLPFDVLNSLEHSMHNTIDSALTTTSLPESGIGSRKFVNGQNIGFERGIRHAW